MTLIVGMFYGDGKGALIISDSRMMADADYSRERKIEDLGHGVVFSASGYVGVAEKLIPAVKQTRIRARRFLRPEVVDVFEDEMAAIWRRYKGGAAPRFARDDRLLAGIIGFVDEGTPQLYCLHENGYAESVKGFRTIGDGSRHAHNVLRTLHRNSISKDEALQIGTHAIAQVATVDAVVDAYPQIVVLEKDVGDEDIKILNCDADGIFQFECQEIDDIKKKVIEIEEKRTQAFRLLLNGPQPLVKKLDKLLKEYENGRTPAGQTEAASPAEE